MKTGLLSLFAMLLFSVSFAQYPVVTIQDIQFVQPAALGNCDDQTVYLGDTVSIRAKVVMDGNKAVPSGVDQGTGLPNPTGHKNVWLQQGNGGEWSGLDVFQLSSISASEDIWNLLAGDSIQIDGVIDDYQGETEIIPLSGSSITLLGQGTSIVPTVISLGDLNDENDLNQLATGERWEGVYVEMHNVTVVDVDNFTGGRVAFDVQDQFGNLLGVSDRFIVQRTPSEGGNFVAPNVGDQLDTLRGIITHSKNNCPGSTGRGYELQPFDESHYVYGASAPSIFNISNTPAVPAATDDITVNAEITDNDGNVVSATVYYATGVSGGSFVPVTMSTTGNDIYTADIPAQADGTFVRWYISATDDSALVATLPNTDPNVETYSYRVRNNGLTIFDINFTPYAGGNSPYENQSVTVEGVVTSTILSNDTGDLGHVFIQQENQLSYAGIWLADVSSAALNTLERGDMITVEGVIGESNGMTVFSDIVSINVTGTGSVSPLVLNPDTFTTTNGSHEQYEGMLVTFAHPTAGSSLYVVEQNADESTGNNYAEYRIGTDQFALNGGRVIAGRQSGNSNSSLYVSYVNDSIRATQDGTMQVTPYVVKQGHYMESMTGILYYSYGAMKLLPRNNNDVVGYGGGIVYAMAMAAADTICVGDTLQFTNMSSVIADNLSWDFGDAATSTDFNPAHAYTTVGSYSVGLVATNTVDNASATADPLSITVIDDAAACGLGVNEHIGRAAQIFPNPTHDIININTGFETGTEYSVNVFDLQGRVIANFTSSKTIESLDLSSFDAGTYLMQIKSANGETLQVSQIIKK